MWGGGGRGKGKRETGKFFKFQKHKILIWLMKLLAFCTSVQKWTSSRQFLEVLEYELCLI
jgi:hypothetical protein